MSTLVSILIILFIAEFVRSSIGFGNALVAMPLLALLMDLQVATPLFALTSMTASLTILGSNWRDVQFKDAWRLNVGALLGIPFGIWVLNNVPQHTGVTILAVLIITYAVYSLWTPDLPYMAHDRFALGVGALAGLTNAAFNVAGPPIVVYGSLRRWNPTTFRATMQSFFVPTGFGVLLGHALSGLWTDTMLSIFVFSIPVVLLATVTGGFVNQRLPHKSFRKIINVFLIIVGVFMLVGL